MNRIDELTKKYEATIQILNMMHDDFGNPTLSQEQMDSLILSMIATYLYDISISVAMLVDDKYGESDNEVRKNDK